MAETVVLDAGVALAWFIDPVGERADYASALLEAYKKNEIRFIVPDIFFVEVPYVLMKAVSKGNISKETMAQAARFIDLVTSDVVPSNMSIEENIDKAMKWELKAYDATYFDLAVTLDVPIAAIDIDLVKKAEKFKIPLWKPAK
ncbi:type II toxin-antitoxin system VapC family toxin [Undibacterium sp. FT79W]|uniref:type II toxin-antitoxin system VapC family toxin n=1 Tax=Undibacterium sp. FT79W TaxID=2762296 RepID=UPI00164AC2F7|nr:type II toxin-antitoxin system VapC family toxin [Undibacterium sp. FT79W]MBC3878776.1 type II toxin-antitoxin system VapC family toxin [Undibacterium sp. FT79W]